MAEAIKVLGQLKPAPATLSALYTVPALTTAVASTITACEQAGAATKFRISVAVVGAADAPTQYLFYDADIGINETKTITIGMTLGAADVVRVYSTSGSVSFNAFGAETS